MARQLILLLLIVVGAGLLVARAPDAGATPIPAPPVSQVLSPVTGPLEIVTNDANCSGAKWCFNQHKEMFGNIGHGPRGGICHADDTHAWDANLNTPERDSDADKPVFAVAEGVVAESFGGCLHAKTGGTVGQVLVQHTAPNGAKWWSGYLHMKDIRVAPGQEVTQDTVLGTISNKGVPDGNNHLHFVVYTGTNTGGGLQSFNAAITARSDLGTITTVAGGSIGDGGPATSASLSLPSDVAVDAAGNLFIADTGNDRIRKVAATTGIITTVTGTGTTGFSGDGGLATAASLRSPAGVTVDAAGNLFIADRGNSRIRRVAAGTGTITTVAGTGTAGFSGDGGLAIAASLRFREGVAVDGAGNLFVADTGNDRIRKVTAATGIITTVAGNGTFGFSGDGGPATSASLAFPAGLAVDGAGNLFIADSGNRRVRKVAAATGVISTVEGTDALGFLTGVAVDGAGNLFIAYSDNQRIRKVDAGTGTITTVAGSGAFGFSGDGGPAISASLASPEGVTVDGAGNLFIADLHNHRVRKVATATEVITTVAGTVGFSGDGGPATSASLTGPHGVAVDSAGNLFIADAFNNRVRKVAATMGVITTVGGTATGVFPVDMGGFSGDGGPATAANLRFPAGVAVDGAGNLFIADSANNRVRKVDAATGVITTVAGTGVFGYSGDGGPATSASLAFPAGVAVDGAGNLLIAERDNVRVRKVAAATGIITTVAGTGTAGFSGDGGLATSASLTGPHSVAVDRAGNLFIADTGNHRVRQVSAATGVITTVAGTGTAGFSGDGGLGTSASLANPQGVAVDGAGNLFIADSRNRIRRVDAITGTITTVAGTETSGFSGDGSPATAASLNNPVGVAMDGAGNLFIADRNNHRIRKVVGLAAPGQLVPGVGPGAGVGITISGTVTDALTPLGTNLVRVWGFNAATQKFQLHDPAAALLSDLTALNRGGGYWINVKSAQTVTLGTGSYNLSAGWNLIGWLG